MIKIYCENCGKFLFNYQKDGPGPLKRAYLDRIDKKIRSKQLTCPKCKEILGTKYVYKKENRPAYRLYVSAVVRKITKVGK